MHLVPKARLLKICNSTSMHISTYFRLLLYVKVPMFILSGGTRRCIGRRKLTLFRPARPSASPRSRSWSCFSHACLHMLKIFSPVLKAILCFAIRGQLHIRPSMCPAELEIWLHKATLSLCKTGYAWVFKRLSFSEEDIPPFYRVLARWLREARRVTFLPCLV